MPKRSHLKAAAELRMERRSDHVLWHERRALRAVAMALAAGLVVQFSGEGHKLTRLLSDPWNVVQDTAIHWAALVCAWPRIQNNQLLI